MAETRRAFSGLARADQTSSPRTRLNRLMSAHFHDVWSLRASATILVRQFESRPTQLREAP